MKKITLAGIVFLLSIQSDSVSKRCVTECPIAYFEDDLNYSNLCWDYGIELPENECMIYLAENYKNNGHYKLI